jgi:hypothetical protein
MVWIWCSSSIASLFLRSFLLLFFSLLGHVAFFCLLIGLSAFYSFFSSLFGFNFSLFYCHFKCFVFFFPLDGLSGLASLLVEAFSCGFLIFLAPCFPTVVF